MDEKDFFAKLAGVGPDGKFSNFQKKNGSNGDKKNDESNFQKNEADFDLKNWWNFYFCLRFFHFFLIFKRLNIIFIS